MDKGVNMSIIRTKLHPENAPTDVLHPETDIEQVELGDSFTATKELVRGVFVTDLYIRITITLKNKSVTWDTPLYEEIPSIIALDGQVLRPEYNDRAISAVTHRYPVRDSNTGYILYPFRNNIYKSLDGNIDITISGSGGVPATEWVIHSNV